MVQRKVKAVVEARTEVLEPVASIKDKKMATETVNARVGVKRTKGEDSGIGS